MVLFHTSCTHDQFADWFRLLKAMMCTIQFVEAYTSNLYLITLLIYLSNLIVQVLIAEGQQTKFYQKLPEQKTQSPGRRMTSQEVSQSYNTALSEGAKSVLYIDAPQDQQKEVIVSGGKGKDGKGKKPKSKGPGLHTQDTTEDEGHHQQQKQQPKQQDLRQQQIREDLAHCTTAEEPPAKPNSPVLQGQDDRTQQLPRAPKGHHVEELQEMEEILNEMTLPMMNSK